MTSQEEIGLRGATTAAYGVNPDVGVAVDVTLACDVPDVKKRDYISKLGEGVAIKLMDSASISDRTVVRDLRDLAEAGKIPHQFEIMPRGGTDTGKPGHGGRYGKKMTSVAIQAINVVFVHQALLYARLKKG